MRNSIFFYLSSTFCILCVCVCVCVWCVCTHCFGVYVEVRGQCWVCGSLFAVWIPQIKLRSSGFYGRHNHLLSHFTSPRNLIFHSKVKVRLLGKEISSFFQVLIKILGINWVCLMLLLVLMSLLKSGSPFSSH